MVKKIALFLFTILLIHSQAHAYVGEVVKKLRAPSPCPSGIAFDGTFLWCCDRKTDTIYKLDRESGRVLKEFSAPGFFPSSICFDGKNLRVADLFEKKIYCMDRETGVFSREIEMSSPDITGMAWDSRHLWVCGSSSGTLSMLDPTDGTTIITIPAPSKNPTGLAFDGKYLWCADRVKDKIYVIDRELKDVLFSIDAPGKYAWGLAWDGSLLWNVDYQSRTLYAIKVRDSKKFTLYDRKQEKLTYSSTIRNYGPGKVLSMDFYVAVPQNMPTQKFNADVAFTPSPGETLTDQYGQKAAHFTFRDIPAGGERRVSYSIDATLWALRYFIYPDEVGSPGEIPPEIRTTYLADGSKYDIHDPYIKDLVKSIVKDEDNLYRKARKLYDYLIAHMEYKLEGGWNTAPTVLRRGTGSCSEYTFCYIALCRAAGIPARYLGSSVVRGDDASYDDVFHRWSEIYIPPYGWIPVDVDSGDEELPADQADAFGGYKNRFIITTRGGGASPYLKWSYNCVQNLSFQGKCRIVIEDLAEWEPAGEDKKQ